MMTPLEYYQAQCRDGFISEDAEQLIVLEYLQSLHASLLTEQRRRKGLLRFLRNNALVHGLYLWGGVGIGKTFLMDCFYNTLPFPQKKRQHFHSFMRWVHQELRRHQGEKNPLQHIARALAQNHVVLCFDEFLVTDIADAMILARLLEALFANGVCLVTTSNTAPDELYKKGLQRPLFLPAIELLKQKTKVMHVPTIIDYRLRYLKDAGVFYTPNDELAENKMEKLFAILTNNQPVYYEPIELCDRLVPIRKQAEAVIWFDFKVLCSIPRSQQDYLALADKYTTIFISNVTILSATDKNRVTLLIRLVDVFYDARIRIVFSAETTVDHLYVGGSMSAEFARTCSRLQEMQSEAYFSVKTI